MTDNFSDISDGENYLSRTRINRRVFTLNGENGFSTTAFFNGKVSKVIIDASRSAYLIGSGAIGKFTISMDIEDDGSTEYTFFDEIRGLNYAGSGTDQVIYLEATPGANKGSAAGKHSLHFAVAAPSTATSEAHLIDEPAAWNGLLVGQCRINCFVDAPNILEPTGTIRVVIITE